MGWLLDILFYIGETLLTLCDEETSVPYEPFSTSETHPHEAKKKKIKRKTFSREFATPKEKDLKLRTFPVVNPEGEVFQVNTADASSSFFGPVWTRILDAYMKGDFVRGRVANRMTGKDGRFSGYVVSVDGVLVFLPASRGGLFRDEEKDATNRCIALKIQDVFTNGEKIGTVIADAKAPYKVIEKELREVHIGKVFHALAMDVDANALIFPSPRYKEIRVPLDQARRVMQQAGGELDDYFMTGLYWELVMIQSGKRNNVARPLRVLI